MPYVLKSAVNGISLFLGCIVILPLFTQPISWHSENMEPMFLGCALNVFQVLWMDINPCIHLGESIPPSHGLPSPDIMADWNTT